MALNWQDKKRAARWFRSPLNRPADWIEANAPEIIDAFEADMFPPADAAQRTAELERVSRELQLLGYDERSELVTAIDAEATLWREARDEPDQDIKETQDGA